MSSSPPLSYTVVETVAEAEAVDPVELEIPLNDVIDPDALEALFESTNTAPRRTGQVTFEYAGHTVVVGSDGTVMVADGSTTKGSP